MFKKKNVKTKVKTKTIKTKILDTNWKVKSWYSRTQTSALKLKTHDGWSNSALF